jgi:hypothetical protein
MTTEEYLKSIDEVGLDETWLGIIKRFEGNDPSHVDGVLSIGNFGELYEIGLAHVNKESKKELGKYFTPEDVATLMAKWLDTLPGENVCDVCCGVGNLILAYLKHIGKRRARELIKSKKLWLYDKDDLALWICVNTIGIIYGSDVVGYIHSIPGDFLNGCRRLPENCKVVSNPPYAKVENFPEDWDQTVVLHETKELYAAMMEKILSQCGMKGAVLLTPQNYLGRGKFKALREKLSTGYAGFVIPFDNTPGQLFNGRKHGVFNSNKQNQVRPAIMVVDSEHWGNGIRVAGMVRFRNGERDKVLEPKFFDDLIGDVAQRPKSDRYAKCFPSLEPLLLAWKLAGLHNSFGSYLNPNGKHALNFATTCRYHTVAYVSDLFRSGKRTLRFNDEETRDLAYCFLNSSFCYWHWRLYDGEITYQQGMLEEMPVFFPRLSPYRKRLLEIAKEMQAIEKDNITRKKNSGKMMENIKFPEKYRDEINDILLKQLNMDCDHHVFDIVHAHSVYKDEEGFDKGYPLDDSLSDMI